MERTCYQNIICCACTKPLMSELSKLEKQAAPNLEHASHGSPCARGWRCIQLLGWWGSCHTEGLLWWGALHCDPLPALHCATLPALHCRGGPGAHPALQPDGGKSLLDLPLVPTLWRRLWQSHYTSGIQVSCSAELCLSLKQCSELHFQEVKPSFSACQELDGTSELLLHLSPPPQQLGRNQPTFTSSSQPQTPTSSPSSSSTLLTTSPTQTPYSPPSSPSYLPTSKASPPEAPSVSFDLPALDVIISDPSSQPAPTESSSPNPPPPPTSPFLPTPSQEASTSQSPLAPAAILSYLPVYQPPDTSPLHPSPHPLIGTKLPEAHKAHPSPHVPPTRILPYPPPASPLEGSSPSIRTVWGLGSVVHHPRGGVSSVHLSLPHHPRGGVSSVHLSPPHHPRGGVSSLHLSPPHLHLPLYTPG